MLLQLSREHLHFYTVCIKIITYTIKSMPIAPHEFRGGCHCSCTSLTIFFMFPSQWVNLCIDLGSLVSGLFKAQSYKSLEGVSIGGSCIIRRVFTLKSSPPDTTGTEVSPPFEEIPRAYQMPTSVATAQTQVHVHAACIHVA